MIKIIGFCGSRIKNGNMEALLADALSQAGNHSDVETELITLAEKKINPCNHCNWCIGNQTADVAPGFSLRNTSQICGLSMQSLGEVHITTSWRWRQ